MTITPNSLFVFPETGAKVRVVEIDGNPWFVAADVIRAVGLSMWAGATQHLTTLAADEKQVVLPSSLILTQGRNAVDLLGNARIALVSESGLYKIIMRSEKPTARPFQDWVTRDVLPAIRKDGAYVRGEELLKPGVVETLDLNDLDALRDRIETLMQRKASVCLVYFVKAPDAPTSGFRLHVALPPAD